MATKSLEQLYSSIIEDSEITTDDEESVRTEKHVRIDDCRKHIAPSFEEDVLGKVYVCEIIERPFTLSQIQKQIMYLVFFQKYELGEIALLLNQSLEVIQFNYDNALNTIYEKEFSDIKRETGYSRVK